MAFELKVDEPSDGDSWEGIHLHPNDTGGMMISFDDPRPPTSWAGPWAPLSSPTIVDSWLARASATGAKRAARAESPDWAARAFGVGAYEALLEQAGRPGEYEDWPVMDRDAWSRLKPHDEW